MKGITRRLAWLVAKDWRLLARDWHGLLVLFAMPAVFILIMSMALRGEMADATAGPEFAVHVAGEDALADAFLDRLETHSGFRNAGRTDTARAAERAVADGGVMFALVLHERFGERLADGSSPAATVLIAPTARSDTRELFVVTVRSLLQRVYATQILGLPLPEAGGETAPMVVTRVAGAEGVRPTAVEQSVPAWLVFAMFFVVIPLSSVLISERGNGTLMRMRISNVTPAGLLLGKFPPYLVVNQVQMLLMLLVGVYIVPLLGGATLGVRGSAAGLVLISVAVSIAAIGFALLIAVLARTTVQATAAGGVANIIFGALGGIMVPKFVMPPDMRTLSVLSPMSWGMEGFLDVFVRGGGVVAVATESLALGAFGAASGGLAVLLFKDSR